MYYVIAELGHSVYYAYFYVLQTCIWNANTWHTCFLPRATACLNLKKLLGHEAPKSADVSSIFEVMMNVVCLHPLLCIIIAVATSNNALEKRTRPTCAHYSMCNPFDDISE